jgi:hypothetical protein
MHHTAMSRRRLLRTALATVGAFSVSRRSGALAAPGEIKLPDKSPVETFDFESFRTRSAQSDKIERMLCKCLCPRSSGG